MGNTSSADLAREILTACLAGVRWRESALIEVVDRAALGREGSAALFGILIEQLADRFEPRLCDAYAELFSAAIERVRPELASARTLERYRSIRRPCIVKDEPECIYVLSRITLGSDVAVTSVVLDAVKRRFPGARIRFVGPRKNWELFAADPRIEHYEFSYSRGGSLTERLYPPRLNGGLVLDPDSRITQLGLIPVCDDDDYRFFESRAYGGDSAESITELTQRWTREVLGVAGNPYIAPAPEGGVHDVTVSFGVGENLDKRIDDEFEAAALALLRGCDVLVDEGGGDDERARVRRAIAASGLGAAVWNGAYAPFASAISRSKLFVGYDSAGQHVAAACGVPLVCIFAGSVCERFFQRWQPTGPGHKRVIRVDARGREAVLNELAEALR